MSIFISTGKAVSTCENLVRMAENATISSSGDLVHCTICTKPYNEPKMLPCLHNFCLKCLENWSKNHPDQQLSCPTCMCPVEVPSSGISGLPNNFVLVSLKEQLEEVRRLSKQNPDYNCHICRSKNDMLFCLDCMMSICTGCKETHDRFTRSQDHSVIPSEKLCDQNYLQRVISTQEPNCYTHKKEKLHYYCTQCSQLACQVCAIVNHQGHKTLHEVESRVKSVKAQFDIFLEQSSTDRDVVAEMYEETVKSVEKIREQISGLKSKVEDRYEEMVTKLQCDKQKLLEQYSLIEKETCAKLDDISKWYSTTENMQKMTRTVLQQENSWEILEMEKGIVESFTRLELEKRRMTSLSIPEKVLYDFLPTKLKVIDENFAQQYNSEGYESYNKYDYSLSREQMLSRKVENQRRELSVLQSREKLLKPIDEFNMLGTCQPKK